MASPGSHSKSSEHRSVGPSNSPKRRALFVDRDGTLIPDLKYLADAERLELFEGVADGIRLARAHGFTVLCVTNQSGVARGLYSVEDIERIHHRLNELLRKREAQIDAFYFCPHAPDQGCDCRKPGTALFRQAQTEWNLDLPASAIVGDRAIDVEAGTTLNLLTAIVPPRGHEVEVAQELETRHVVPEIRASSFLGAVVRILARG